MKSPNGALIEWDENMGRYDDRILLEVNIPAPPKKKEVGNEEHWLENFPGVHNYWITPAGERIRVDVGKHEKYADDWLLKNDEEWAERSFFDCENLEELDTCKELEDRGWIRVLNWKVREFSFVSAPGRKKIPQCQKKAIADICVEAGIPFPDELNW